MVHIKNRKTIAIIFYTVIFIVVAGIIIYGVVSFNIEKQQTNKIETVNAVDLCNGQYNTDYFKLIINNDEYVLASNNANNYFSGTCEKYSGDEIKKYVSDTQIYKTGLNPSKINYNNLVLIKLKFNEHIYENNVEYYNESINRSNNDYFSFLIYFINDNGKIYSAAHCIDDISEVDLSQSYF